MHTDARPCSLCARASLRVQGFRASSRASNALPASEANVKLEGYLAAWGRLILLVQCARLTALGIGALAILERLLAASGSA